METKEKMPNVHIRKGEVVYAARDFPTQFIIISSHNLLLFLFPLCLSVLAMIVVVVTSRRSTKGLRSRSSGSQFRCLCLNSSRSFHLLSPLARFYITKMHKALHKSTSRGFPNVSNISASVHPVRLHFEPLLPFNTIRSEGLPKRFLQLRMKPKLGQPGPLQPSGEQRCRRRRLSSFRRRTTKC